MPSNLLIVRQPGPWPVPAAAVLEGLPSQLQTLPREDFEVNTGPFASQIEQGDWEGQGRFLAEKASEILGIQARLGGAEIHYFGLAEVPHVIALGAYLGDEVPIIVHEYDRDVKSWAWPSSSQSLHAEVVGLPPGPPVQAEGTAVLRVEVSFAISDQDVQAAVGGKHLGEARVMLKGAAAPGICRVLSPADLHEVRLRIREAIALLRTRFPNLSTLHVFAAAPASVCFALGQELKPRNSPPIRTYRFRKFEGRDSYVPAIELSAALRATAEAVLTGEERVRAGRLRDVWREVLAQMDTYVGLKRDQLTQRSDALWFELLEPGEPLRAVRPFPDLPPAPQVVRAHSGVDDAPVPTEYGLTTYDNQWHLSDRLLLGFAASANGNDAEFRDLVRLFLFHESLHEHHSLSKLRATGVGRFPNCLEFIDYTADAYALLHQLDSQRARERRLVESEEQQLEYLRTQLGLVLRSYWAFEPSAPVAEWQVRRVRRYLNWYWRLAQLEQTRDMVTAVRLLARPPHVELAGLHQVVRSPRHFCNVERFDEGTPLELALVMENHKLLRITETASANLRQLLAGFRDRDGDAILRFFRLVFEEAKDKQGALPIH